MAFIAHFLDWAQTMHEKLLLELSYKIIEARQKEEGACSYEWALEDDIQTSEITNSSLYKLIMAVKVACFSL